MCIQHGCDLLLSSELLQENFCTPFPTFFLGKSDENLTQGKTVKKIRTFLAELL